jgi:hypothetical protein
VSVFIHVALPILAHVAPYWLWTTHVRHERIVTATAAIQQAQKYQALVRSHGKCVSSLPGWDTDAHERPGTLVTQVKVTGKRLMIECDQMEKKFWVSISFPRDNFGHVEGQFNGPLNAAYWRGEKLETSAILQDANTDELAKLLAFGD